MANVNITGFQIGDNTYYPRRMYIAQFDAGKPSMGLIVNECDPISGVGIVINFEDTTTLQKYGVGSNFYIKLNDEELPIVYCGVSNPWLWFSANDTIELVCRGEDGGGSPHFTLINYPHNMIPISYNNLKDERDNGRLIPGMKYRITDYVTQCYYTATSSEHPFDIVVTAIDNSTLDENAKAMKRDGDEYFANCDLSKWEIKYTLDADPNRFEWAMSGEYVEYRTQFMMDDYDIVRYDDTKGVIIDSRNIEYFIIPDSLFEFGGEFYYATNHPGMFVMQGEMTPGNYLYSLETDWDVCGFVNPNIVSWIDNNGYNYLSIDGSSCFVSGDPTDRNIYELYFEDYNGYQISNIQQQDGTDDFLLNVTDGVGELLLLGNKNWIFEYNGNQYYKLKDNYNNYGYLVRCDNLVVGYLVYEVYVDIYDVNYGYVKNNYPEITKGIIYHMKDEWGNECPYDFKNIMFNIKGFETVTNNRYYYTFTNVRQNDMSKTGKYLNNIIKPNFSYAGFDKCQVLNNIILSCDPSSYTDVSDNIFDYDCYNIFIGTILKDTNFNLCENRFGKHCHDNNVVTQSGGSGFYGNTFGNYCCINTFENGCNNTFGNYFQSNTFANGCNYNTFGNSCYNNTLRSLCCNNNFGNFCSSNTLGSSSTYNTFGDYCTYNTFGDYFQSNILMNSVKYCKIKQGASTNATNRSYCKYNTFNTGVQLVSLVAAGSMGASYITKNIVVHSDLNLPLEKYINVSTNKETVTNVYYKTPTSVNYTS